MNYNDVVADFAARTKHNLEFIRKAHRENPGSVYEVTQLVNSLLGLLVFPQQRYVHSIPATPLAELERAGWPIPQVEGSYPQVKDLNQLFRYLRNAVAHSNIEFLADERGDLTGIVVWNIPNVLPDANGRPRRNTAREIDWRARLSLAQLGQLVDNFLALLLDKAAPAQDEPFTRLRREQPGAVSRTPHFD